VKDLNPIASRQYPQCVRASLLAVALVVLTGLSACSQRAAPISSVGSGSTESGPVAMAMPIAAPGDFSGASVSGTPLVENAPAPFAAPVTPPSTEQRGSAVIVSGGPANLGELKL